MINISRRRLARYGADELLNGVKPALIAQQLAAILVLTKRDKQLDLLLSDIAWELESRGKVATSTVTTAHPLTEELKEEVIKFIERSAKVERAILEESIDESVLGGIRIETTSHSWDKTAKGELMNIREAF